MQEADGLGHRHDEQPVGLGPARGELGDELGGRGADRAAQPGLAVRRARAMRVPICQGVPSSAQGARDVEERLVDAQRLDPAA